jgi:Tol biopolymer transport system component
LTTLPGNEQQPSLSPDGTQVAFEWNGEGADNVDLYIMPVGTGTPLRLTTDPEVDTGPAWSPDGSQIAFVRQPRAGATARTIYLATPPLPNAERKLAEVRPPVGAFHNATTLSWFPDSRRLVVEDADSTKTWIQMIPIDRGPGREVLSMPISEGTLHYPAVSTSGTMLAYAVCTSIFTCNLYVIDLRPDGTTEGPPRQLTHENSEVLGLAWAADDRSLLYGSGVLATSALRRVPVTGGPSEVLQMAADRARTPAVSRRTGSRVAYARADFDMDIWQFQPNGAPSRSPLSSTLDDRNPQLSPDGTRVAFESRRLGKESQLWIANADGTKVTQLTEGGRGIQGSPFWSPDGNWIVFDGTLSANQSGIWVVEASGGQPRLLSAPGIVPSWSRDGKWVYFTRNGPVWRIPAQGGAAEQVTEGNGSNAVESPDGAILYYARANAIFAKPSGGGAEWHVMDMSGSAPGGGGVHRWFPVDDGICYLTRPEWKTPFQLELRFMDLRSRKETVLHRFVGGNGIGLTASRDRKTMFYSGTAPSQGSDLMLIQDFR